MNSIRGIAKALIALLSVALIILLTKNVRQGQINSSQAPELPTAIPERGFVVDIPQKALWKNYFVVSAEASPGTTCELLYIPPSGQSQQLTSTADANGQCAWRWKIEEIQGKGYGRLIFTIDGKSETHFFEIRSSF